MNQDIEHLRLLSIFHYVMAGLMALFACLPVFHLVMGLFMLFAPEFMEPHRAASGPATDFAFLRIIGCAITAVASIVIALGWSFAYCIFLTAGYLRQCRRYTFCLVIAGILCTFAPLGTVLGVFTIVVLMQPSVKALFTPPLTATNE